MSAGPHLVRACAGCRDGDSDDHAYRPLTDIEWLDRLGALEARIAELEAERDAAKQWATELQGRQRHHIARIEELEAELREVLRSPGDIHVVLDGIRRALTTSTQEDARR